jgi:capsular polysaccharide transport system permease protein
MAETGTPLDRFRAQARAITAEVGASPAAVSAGRLAQLFRALNLWFWAIVGLPTLIAGVYFFGIAANLYMSETEFVVRSPKSAQVNPVTAFLHSAGLSRSSDDSAVVADYIMSRAAVRKLEHHDNLRTIFDRPQADFVTRFPNLFGRTDFEALYAHYKHFVSVVTDGDTGITVLRVKAYTPADAQKLAAALVADSQQLINQLNRRSRRDALALARHEVDRIEHRILHLQDELTAYRVREKMINPKTASTGVLLLIQQMTTAETNARAQLAELQRNSPDSPQLPLIRTRIASLDRLIAQERAKLSGQDHSVVSTMTEYENLVLQRELAEKELVAAFTSLEAARVDAERQQVYLEPIAPPNLPDYPLYPERALDFSIVVISCLLVYALAWLLVASVNEHAAA